MDRCTVYKDYLQRIVERHNNVLKYRRNFKHLVYGRSTKEYADSQVIFVDFVTKKVIKHENR